MTDPIRNAINRAFSDLVNDSADDTEQPAARGPYHFYEAEPIRASGDELQKMIDQLIAAEPALTREQAHQIITDSHGERLALSTEYQVAVRLIRAADDENPFGTDLAHLSIKRLDREPMHDWRALQSIKNAIVGEECEAIEIYPAESRLVDTANQYHLWAMLDPNARIPLGFVKRLVDECSIGKSKQRPFASPDALMPSRAQLVSSLRELSVWMRDNTGPADGAHEMLVRAVALLDQVDKATSSKRGIYEVPR